MRERFMVCWAIFFLGACGSPPPSTPPTPVAETAVASLGPAPSSTAPAETEAADQCLATANAKRAKFSGEPPKVRVKHVLVKHKGSKNPVVGITRTREQACLRAMAARDALRGGAEMDSVVKDYSDEAGAATRGGSLGTVERHDVATPFADAAFELGVNQLSDVVETEFGFHVILRTE